MWIIPKLPGELVTGDGIMVGGGFTKGSVFAGKHKAK